MKVDSIRSNSIYTKGLNVKCANKKTQPCFSMPEKKYFSTLSFCGYPVHIVDGGAHAENMWHFAKAISNDMELESHIVEVNKRYNSLKQLKSLEEELKNLNTNTGIKCGDYVAVPALATVSILNLEDQYYCVMRDKINLTPENIKSKSKDILAFLKKIYENPQVYRQYINYLDPSKQGIEYSYGVIREINSLVKKGVKVYIPSGHPHSEGIKTIAKERNISPELYNFIATGKDSSGRVKALINEVKRNKWYDFNLLSLSDAHIVNVKDKDGINDYIFAAYDSCITDGTRGVYNFTPIRDGTKIVGYSYTDCCKNEYPYEEFPANDEVANIAKFTGRKLTEVLANDDEIKQLQTAILNGQPTEKCPDKLYPIEKVFTLDELKAKKINLEGDYTNRQRDLFFRVNSNNEVVFPRCNCEGSEKPSVLSMWGSCFSVFNAIQKDIELRDKKIDSSNYTDKIMQYIGSVEFLMQNGLYQQAESVCNDAIQYNAYIEEFGTLSSMQIDHTPYLLMGDILCARGKTKEALLCYNSFLNKECAQLLESLSSDSFLFPNKNFNDIKETSEKNNGVKKQWEKYRKDCEAYIKKSFFATLFSKAPKEPDIKEDLYKSIEPFIEKTAQISETYSKIGNICLKNNEDYPAKVCMWASLEIGNFGKYGGNIIKKRSEGIQYIGDIYDENSSNQ